MTGTLNTYDLLDEAITQMLACGMDAPNLNGQTKGTLNAYAHVIRWALEGKWEGGTALDRSDHPVTLMQAWALELGPRVRTTWDGWAYDYTAQRRIMHARILGILRTDAKGQVA